MREISHKVIGTPHVKCVTHGRAPARETSHTFARSSQLSLLVLRSRRKLLLGEGRYGGNWASVRLRSRASTSS